MKIIDFLNQDCVIADMTATSKQAALEELAATLVPGPEGLELAKVVDVLMERERLGSTGIGDNVAIPHGKLDDLSALKLVFGRSLKGVDFESMDGKLTHLFFLLLAPINSAGLHLKALAKISRMLMNATFRENLMQAPQGQDIYQLLATKDQET
ncbi:MAG: PTS sugar transporter subunit IIA [Syntrophobacterales bacterium]|jgi:PTS system nitrogen regulatory IIA component